MDAVMLDTKVEKLSIAITITQTVNVRSCIVSTTPSKVPQLCQIEVWRMDCLVEQHSAMSTEFCGFTCIVAGVNCVKDQCSETAGTWE
eukprot:6489688-Amphidinium_carterae.2